MTDSRCDRFGEIAGTPDDTWEKKVSSFIDKLRKDIRNEQTSVPLLKDDLLVGTGTNNIEEALTIIQARLLESADRIIIEAFEDIEATSLKEMDLSDFDHDLPIALGTLFDELEIGMHYRDAEQDLFHERLEEQEARRNRLTSYRLRREIPHNVEELVEQGEWVHTHSMGVVPKEIIEELIQDGTWEYWDDDTTWAKPTEGPVEP